MDDILLTYKERLEKLEKGTSFVLGETETAQGVYSAIRDNPETFKKMTFSIRTHPTTLVKHVYRTK